MTTVPWNSDAGRRRDGFALPLVLFALIILALVAATAFRTAADGRLSARSTREYTLALYAAESGIRQTIGAWPKASVVALNPGDSLDLGWQSLPNRGAYRAVIHRVDRGFLQMYAVIVRGRGKGALSGQQMLTTVVGGVPLFRWGIFSESGIALGGAFTLSDSYNSEEGPYNAAAADSAGSLATNANVTLNGDPVIKGDVSAVGSVTSDPNVTGSITSGVQPFPSMPTIACPTGAYTPAANVPNIDHVSYNAATGELSVSSGVNLILPNPPSQYYFSSVKLTGNATLTVTVGAQPTNVIISGELSLGGGGIVNTGGDPTKLAISACGNPVGPASWGLAGGVGAAFTVYAPDRDVAVTGGSDFFGAIVGLTVSVQGGTKIHYDSALSDKPSQFLSTVNGSWAQIR